MPDGLIPTVSNDAPPAMGLTPVMCQCMRHIQDALDGTGIAPSYQELMDVLGIRSKSNIWRLVHELMERGYLRQLPYRRRSLQVVRRVPVEIPDPRYVMSADLAERRGQ